MDQPQWLHQHQLSSSNILDKHRRTQLDTAPHRAMGEDSLHRLLMEVPAVHSDQDNSNSPPMEVSSSNLHMVISSNSSKRLTVVSSNSSTQWFLVDNSSHHLEAMVVNLPVAMNNSIKEVAVEVVVVIMVDTLPGKAADKNRDRVPPFWHSKLPIRYVLK